ncbi:MAG: MFS transporter [Thermomicrobiales bacterium]|nr:MFS transporter [Thermomicrobiales bacterium]
MPAPTRYTLRTWMALAVLCLAAAVNLLQSASISPLLPGISATFNAGDAATGQLATIGSLAGFAFSLAATPWMDRLSRRNWLRINGSMILGGMLLSAFAPSFAVLAVGRIISACGGALIMANCMTGARELFHDPVWRNRAIGFIVSATTLVFVLGLPVITQINARLGWRSAMMAIVLPALLLVLGSALIPPSPEAPVSPRASPLSAFGEAFGDRRIRGILVGLALCSAIYNGWFVYFGAYTTTVFAVSASVLSALFFAAGAMQLVANNVAPILMRRFDPVSIFVVAMVMIASTLLTTGILIVNIPGALLAAASVLIGSGLSYIAANVLLLDSSTRQPGAVMALAGAAGALGGALGPLASGLGLAATGSFEAAYRVVGLMAPLAILAIWLGTRTVPQPQPEIADSPS